MKSLRNEIAKLKNSNEVDLVPTIEQLNDLGTMLPDNCINAFNQYKEYYFDELDKNKQPHNWITLFYDNNNNLTFEW